MTIFTIGFTGKDAARFFGLLEEHKVKTLLDIRLNNKSQLAGFTKMNDLEYFLQRISGIAYRHLPELAPSKEILDSYRGHELDWEGYELAFDQLLQARKTDKFLKSVIPGVEDPFCLLCSEAEADKCHRRLVAQRIQKLYPKAEIIHL